MSVSGNYKERDALQARKGAEQNAYKISKENVSFLSLTFIYSLSHPSPTTLSNVLLFSEVKSRRRLTQVAWQVRGGRV